MDGWMNGEADGESDRQIYREKDGYGGTERQGDRQRDSLANRCGRRDR